MPRGLRVSIHSGPAPLAQDGGSDKNQALHGRAQLNSSRSNKTRSVGSYGLRSISPSKNLWCFLGMLVCLRLGEMIFSAQHT